jgi:hypothetical protein
MSFGISPFMEIPNGEGLPPDGMIGSMIFGK